MNEIEFKEKIMDLGYTEKQASKILNAYSLRFYTKEVLKSRISAVILFFLMKKFPIQKVTKITTKSPEILGFSIQTLQNRIYNLEQIGYNEKQIQKLISSNSDVITYPEEYIQNKIAEFKKAGYPKNKFIKMTLKLATLFDLDIENNIKAKQKELIDLGFSEEQMKKMTTSCPDIFSFSKKNISDKMDNIEKLGFDRETVIYMLYKLPTLFGLSIKNIAEKINYLKEINALEAAIKNPSNLIQSVKLTYARNEFFNDNNIIFEIENHRYIYLYVGVKQFERKYNISKKELLNKYKYKDYCEAKKNGKTT